MDYIEKEKIINNLIEKKQYEKAIKALAYLIQLTNRNILKNKLYKDTDTNTNLYNTMEIYRMLNSSLYQTMLDVNYIYEEISNNKEIDKSFVVELKNKYYELKSFIDM